MARFETILFDADETLLDFSMTEKNALSNALAEAGIILTKDMRLSYKKINKTVWTMLERGKITKEHLKVERWQRFIDHYDMDLDAKTMGARYLHYVGEGAFLVDGARQLCEDLHKDFELSIVTNGIGNVQHKRLDKADIKKYFKGIFISEEIGFNKPDIRYFDVVFETLNIMDKSKVIIVGDSLTSDMQGGINAGIATCWYNPFNLANDTDVVCDYEIKNLNELKDIIQ